jgi:putative ubiquitin-RnfH superfamily antitoxin RatB of RatAB toxin-antitoxin module
MRITLAYSPASRVALEATIDLPEGSTVATALNASQWREQHALDTGRDVTFGIWNRPATLQTPLKPNDRVEIYRPLNVDPKVARRERFHKQGAKVAGLFASRRPGAKPGY